MRPGNPGTGSAGVFPGRDGRQVLVSGAEDCSRTEVEGFMREIVATGMKPEEGEEGSNPITIQVLRKGRSLLTFRES